MSRRIHIVVDDSAWAAFRARARAEGRTLSEWLRQAADGRLRDGLPEQLHGEAALDKFFQECDERESGREPNWDEHLEVISASRATGQASS